MHYILHMSLFFPPFVYLEIDVAFSEYFLYHFRFIFVVQYGEYVVRSFLPNGVFLPCDHELDF